MYSELERVQNTVGEDQIKLENNHGYFFSLLMIGVFSLSLMQK